MRKKVFYRICLPAMFIMIGCQGGNFPVYIENASMETANIEVLTPAEITVNPEVENIVVLSDPRFTAFFSATDPVFVDSAFFNKQHVLQNIQSITTDFLVSSPRFNALEDPSVFSGEIQTIMADNKADGILNLKTINISANTKLMEKTEWYSNNYLTYFTVTELDIKATWELLDKNAIIIACKNSRYYEKIIGQSAYFRDEALENTPDINEYLEYGIFVICDNISSYLAPAWKTTPRKYYSAGSKLLKKAAIHAENQHWDDAINAWKQAYRSDKYIPRKHACFNLILGYELLGNLDSALIMANKSIREYSIVEAVNYKRSIEERKEQIKILNEQLFSFSD